MTTESRISEKRSSRLQKNILASFIAKGWSAVIVLLMVPVTLNCLGDYNNGVWLTISSVMLWIDNLDIGLGNGMRNKLAIYLAHGEEQRARSLVSSTFAMLTYIIIPTLLVLLALIMICDTYQLLNVEPDKVGNLDQIRATPFGRMLGYEPFGQRIPELAGLHATPPPLRPCAV